MLPLQLLTFIVPLLCNNLVFCVAAREFYLKVELGKKHILNFLVEITFCLKVFASK